jgi:cysteine-S-conjugate beta-lyase
VSAPPAIAVLSLDELRLRRSEKWLRYPPDVLPAWVAETDFELAPAVRDVLLAAVERGDTGYASPGELPEAFAGFAADRFGWTVDPSRVHVVADVMTGVLGMIETLTEPGDGVVVSPPVYPPFFFVTKEAGRTVVEAPLDASRRLDLDALERAFAGGARAYLLCNPHNPTGTVFTANELEGLAALAAAYDVLVVSDEVHAPMTMPGEHHVPFLALGGDAAEHGVAIVSASKTWNLAGLKCAMVVAASERMQAELGKLPEHLRYHVGHFGVLAALAAFRDDRTWLDALIARLDANRRLLAELLADRLAAVGYHPPGAGYLAWLDCRELGLGDDPAAVFLERGRVALSSGVPFGEQGNGYARLNFGTSPALLEDAVRRMAASL